ncbi:hypothetical protein JTE90_003695 [Oedothorax gibbosus]|uniref:Cell division control protein n=1 Tax=Oedothorax gibbosus TaxID=931172 RepID=A0AAV6VR04_9ARAC|nr:hypothetical protein JTE90_003695 [Oedothorax gibbosus]
MPLQSQLKFPVKKRTATPRNSKKLSENAEPGPKTSGVKRALFGAAESPAASPKKTRISNENVSVSSSPSKNKTSSLSEAKHAFHTGLPNRLIGRSKEIADIHCFLTGHIDGQTSGSLYISGAPGTGKTSSLMFVKNSIKKQFRFAFVNCMSVNTSTGIYRAIAQELGISTKVVSLTKTAENLKKFITQNATILVLDEIDQLDTKGQEVLYSLFEWPRIPNSKLILVGVANALDLTDRILPRLHTFQCQPKLMHFQPYTKDQIVSILEDRLSEVQSNGQPVVNPMAVQLCARKIAASTGDIRKALDVCRRAVEVVENRSLSKPILGSTSDDRCNPGSPSKRRPTTVDLQDITSVLHDVYGSRLQTSSSSGGAVSMPLQHTLLLCTLVLMRKHIRPADMTLGKLYDTYRRVCVKRDIAVVSECAFHGMCKLVESRGFLSVRPNKVARMSKVILKVEENEAEHVLQDKAMLPSILADRSVLAK